MEASETTRVHKEITQVHFSTLHPGGSSSDLPATRQGHTGVEASGRLWVHAGRVPSVSRSQGRNFLPDLWRQEEKKSNPKTNRNAQYKTSLEIGGDSKFAWQYVEQSGDVPDARHNHSAVIHNQRMWVFGGSGFNITYYNDLYCFAFDTQTWTMIHPSTDATNIHALCEKFGDIPHARHGHSVVVFNNCMWVFGGKASPKDDKYFDDIHCFDFDTLKWKLVEPSSSSLPHSRCWHSSVLVNHSMIVFGGFYMKRRRETYFNDLWVFDLNNLTWKKAEPRGEVPHERNRHICLVFPLGKEEGCADGFCHQMWIQGGNHFDSKSRQDQFFSDSFVLTMAGDPQSWTWKKVRVDGDRVPDRGHHTAVAFQGSDDVVIFGGEKKRKRYNDVILAVFSSDQNKKRARNAHE